MKQMYKCSQGSVQGEDLHEGIRKSAERKMPRFGMRKFLYIIVVMFFVGMAGLVDGVQAQTQCQPVAVPMSETFDSWGTGADVLPDCWVRRTNYDEDGNYPQIVGTPTYGSSVGALKLYCGSNNAMGHYAMVIGPKVSTDVNTLYVRLKMRASGYSGTKIEVGVCDTTSNSHNFTPVDTLTTTTQSQWEEKVVDMSSYSGNGRYIALRMIRSLQSYNGLSVYIDDFMVEPCGVWHQRQEQRDVDNFWIAWDTISTPTVNIEYGPTGFAAGSGTTVQNVISPYQLTGLLPNTAYDIRFYASCNGGTPSAAGILTASTLPLLAAGLNYCTGFEDNGSDLPTGWRAATMCNNTPMVSTSSYYAGSRGLRFYSYNCRPVAVLPRVDTTAINRLTLSFMLRSYYAGAQVEVGVMTYPESVESFVPVDTVFSTTTWARQTVSLAPYSGAGRYVALRVYDPHDYYVYVDNVELATCMLANVGRSGITSHGVELQWDTVTTAFHGDSVIIEYGPAGFATGTGTRISVPVRGNDVATTGGRQRYTVDNLGSDSVYEFIVYGACDIMEQHCEPTRLSAHTLAQNITLPYCIDFEQYDNYSYPFDWERPSMFDGRPYVRNSQHHSGSMSLNMHAYGGVSSSHSTAVLPLMDVTSLQGVLVSFWGYGTSNGGSYVQVGVMTSPSDESTFTAVGTFELPYYGWQQYVADFSNFSGSGLYLAFRYYHSCNNCYYEAWIDDIEVSNCVVRNVRHYSERATGVTLAWEGAGSTYGGATVEFGPAGFTRGTGTTVATDANTFSLTLDTLTAGTSYDYYVSATCSDQQHNCALWNGTFTTMESPYVATVCETFMGYSSEIPTGWVRPLMYSYYPRIEYGQLRMNAYQSGTANYTSLAVMPYLEESDLTQLKVRFNLSGEDYSYMVVGVMDNPLDTNTFVAVDTVRYSSSSAEHVVDLATYSGNGHHIAFWQWSEGGNRFLNISKLSIERCRIVGERAYSPTTSTVMLRWETDNNTESVELQYNWSSDSVVVMSNVTSPLQLTGLEAGRSYLYSLIPHCTGSSNACVTSQSSFVTLSNDLGDGWCDGFENSVNSYDRPLNWTTLRAYSSWPMVYNHGTGSEYVTEGAWALEFRTSSSDSNLISMPYSIDTVSNLTMTLHLRTSSSYFPERATLVVGVMTLPYDASTFVAVDTLHPTNYYRTVTVDFSNYAGNGHHIAFLYKDDGDRYTYIDGMSLSRCKVKDVRIDQVTDHSMRLGWSRVGYTGSTHIRCTDADGNVVASIDTTATQVTFTGLTAATDYRFQLWASCQDTALDCQSTEIDGGTLDQPMVVPYCYGFESEQENRMPRGWVRPYGNEYPRVVRNQQHSGSYALQFYANNNSYEVGTTSMAVMPMLDPDSVDGVNGLTVDGWMWSDNANLRLVVGVMTDPADTNTFVALDSLYAYGTRHFKVQLGSYNGAGCYVAFKAVGRPDSYSGNITLDDINLRSCYIGSVHAHHPTRNSISVSWQAGTAQGVFIEYVAVGGSGGDFNIGTGTTVHATQSPYRIEGLQSATWYAMHVYPDCDGAMDGCNYETAVMQTLHESVDVPYCDDFDNYDEFPENWYRLSTYNSASNPQLYSVSHSGGHSMVFTTSDTDYALVAMPPLRLSSECTIIDSMYLNFWTYSNYNSNTSEACMLVGTMTDIYDASTFVVHDTVWDTAYTNWQHHTVAIRNLNTANEYVAFKYVSLTGSMSRTVLDDLCVEKCVAIDVTIGNITQNSVTVTWNSNGVDSMLCEYGPRGFLAGEGTQVVMYNSPYVIDNLVEGMEYQFAFAPICGCDQYGEAYMPDSGSHGWTYLGGWGWGWGLGGGPWGWGWWGGRTWWEIPPGHPTVTPPVIPAITQAGDLEVPYCESFESCDSLPYPSGWRRISNANASFPQASDGNHLTGELCFDFFATPGHYNYASLPPLEAGDVQNMVMTFNAYANNDRAVSSNYNHFQVGVMSDPDDPATFVALDTIHLTARSKWQPFTVDFADYSGMGQYISFKFLPTGQGYHYYIDDLYVGRCAIDNITVTSMQNGTLLQWHNYHNPDSVIIDYGPQGYRDSNSEAVRWHTGYPVNGSQMTASLQFINPDSSYDLYIYPKCDDTSAYCTPTKITLNPRIFVPYCEDMEGYPYEGMPDNWKRVYTFSDYYPVMVDTFSDGLHAVRFYSGTGTNTTTVLLPELANNETLNGKWLNVRVRSENSNRVDMKFGVLTDTSDRASFQQMASVRNTVAGEVQEFNVQLTGYTGTANRLAIQTQSTSNNQFMWLDGLVISSSPYPMGIRDSEHGYATRTIRWDSGSYYTIEYGANGSFQSVQSDSCSVTLTGLQAGKEYEVYFVGSDGVRFCQPYTFTTPEPHAVPYCEDFESYSRYDVPTGWRRLNDGSYYCVSNDGIRPRVWNGVGVDGSMAIDFYSSCMQVFILPEFAVDDIRSLGLSCQISFQNTSDYMCVGIMDDPSDASTFVPVDTLRCASSSMEQKRVDFSRYQGTGRYVAFMSKISGTRAIYVDNVNVQACPMPTITVAGTDRFRIETPSDSTVAVDYWVEYGPKNFQQGSGTELHVESNPFFVTGLQTGTVYDFYVHCDSAGYSCAEPMRDSTTGVLNMPYCENFVYGDDVFSSLWTRHCTYSSSYPYISSGSELYFYTYYARDCYAVMPDVATDSIRNLELYFDFYVSTYSTENVALLVGVMTDRNDVSTFEPVDTVRNTAGYSWQPHHVSLRNYRGEGRFIAFCELTTYNGYGIYMDNLRVQDCPHATVSLAGGTSVQVAVDSTRAADLWVEYGSRGFEQGDSGSVVVHIVQNVQTIEDLDAATTYDFYVRCDSAAFTCTEPTTITTMSKMPLPYCENFDTLNTYTIPAGWRSASTYSHDYPYVYSYYYYSPSRCMEFYTYGTYSDYAILPDFDIDSIRHVDLQFMMRPDYPQYSRLIAGVMDNPYDLTTFVAVDTLIASGGSYELKHVSFASYRGSGRFIALRNYNTDNSWRSIYVDDISVQACAQPTLVLSGATTVTCTVDEEAEADYWLEYGPEGAAQGDSGNVIVHVLQSPYQIGNLSSNTTYDFFARCDSAVASCLPATRITTSQQISAPYCERFDYSGTYYLQPTGWIGYQNYQTGASYLPYVSSSSRLYFYCSQGYYCQISMPEFDSLPVNELNLTFSMSSNNAWYSAIVVGVSSDPYDPTTFVAVDTVRNTVNNTYESMHVSLGGYQGSGRFVTLRHYSSSSTRSIYVDSLMVEACDIPRGTRATLYSHNTVRITADSGTTTGFWVEYDTTGFAQGTGHYVYCQSLPYDIELDNFTTYDFYLHCDTVSPTCRPVQTVETTGDPVTLPYCEGFENATAGQMPTGWKALDASHVRVATNASNSGSRKLRMNAQNGAPYYAVLPEMDVDSISQLAVSFYMRCSSAFGITVGVMSDPNDGTTFLPVKSFVGTDAYQRHIVALEGVHHDARFVAFRSDVVNGGSGEVWIDDVYLDSCGVNDFMVRETEASYITFAWKQVGQPDVTIEYGESGFVRGTGTVVTVQNSPYTLNGLNPLTDYTFYFDAVCNENADTYCNLNYHDSVSRFTPAGGTGCIDPTNFMADYTTCFFGTYGNPTASTGVIDYGSSDPRSRHTVHHDPTETDPRTGNLLHTVPEGAEASVRLGNWTSSGSGTGSGTAEAEAIAYSLVVDTNSFDLLILKYAAVLQDPDHDVSVQPRFSLQLLDEDNNLLDSVCGSADFIANSNLGWNAVGPDDNIILWKDWTTVGIDVRAYGGQTIKVQLTTRDCGEGNHFGYAYFTLECMMKSMQSELCGDVDSNRFYAPLGFAYRWYNETDTTVTLGTERSIKVPTDNTTYYCDCSFVDNDDCMFTLSAYAGTRYPLARLNYNVELRDCRFYVNFSNMSTISPDGSDSLATGEGCETAYWNFGNGEEATTYNASTVYDAPGTYTVTLVSGIAGNECTDTLTVELELARDSVRSALTGRDRLCVGDTLRLLATQVDSLSWLVGDVLLNGVGDSLLVMVPDSTATYAVAFTDINGCPDTLRHTVNVYPHYDLHDSVVLCQNELDYLWCDTTITLQHFGAPSRGGNSADFRYADTSRYGCDSLMALHLTLYYNNDTIIYDTVVEGLLPYSFNDTVFAISAFDTADDLRKPIHIATVHGCDSLIDYHLHLFRNDTVYLDSMVCDNLLPFTWNDSLFAASELDSLGTIRKVRLMSRVTGADSLIVMTLTVRPTYDSVDTVVLCQNSLPLTWCDSTFAPGTVSGIYSLQRYSQYGCDSLQTLLLTVDTNTSSLLTHAIVENDLPYTWNNCVFDSAGTCYDTLVNGHGCDSLVTMTLAVYANAVSTLDSNVCQSALPLVWNSATFDTADFDFVQPTLLATKNDTLQTSMGADSVVIMNVTVVPTTFATIGDTIIESQLPYTWNGTVYDSSSFDWQQPVLTAVDTLTLVNVGGCDSIVYHTLLVYRNQVTLLDSAVCDDALPLLWNGLTFDSAGVQYDTLATADGADSLLVLTLTVWSTYDLYDTLVVCRNMLPYTWQDTVVVDSLYAEGQPSTAFDFRYATLSTHGCDSVMSLQLTVGQVYSFVDSAEFCAHTLPYTWRDTIIADSLALLSPLADSTYAIPLARTTALGCDSVYTLSLTLHPDYDIHDTVVICENSLPYSWRDTTVFLVDIPDFPQSIQFLIRDSMSSVYSCDSLLSLHLTVDTNTYAVVHEYVIENNLPYTYHNSVFTTDTDSVVLVLDNVHGCDSIVNYSLTVYRNVTSSAARTVCEDQLPIVWNGVTFTEAGTQSATLLAWTGADSVVTMTLTVNPTYRFDDEIGICFNALPYNWRDTMLLAGTTSGYIQRNLHTAAGCDSVLTLQLTVSDVYQVEDRISSCEPIVWIDGNTYSTDITGPQVTLQSQAGCDSIVTLNFSILPPAITYLADSFCTGSTYWFGGRDLNEGGQYFDSLYTVDHCDSIVILTLTRLALPKITITAEPDCERRVYRLVGQSDVSYHMWSIDNGSWNSDWGMQNSPEVWPRPILPTTFTLTADYLERPTCRVSESITLNPIVVPVAEMNVNPEQLNYEHDHFYALDQSRGALTRMWWVDDDFYGDDVKIVCSPDMSLDSVVVLLVAESEYCTDTARKVIPIFRHSLYAPNAFTPDETSNREFSLFMDGVVEFELSIYNRGGVLVFHTEDPEEKWDGTYNGKPCPQGNYVWICKYTTTEKPRQPETRKGSVLLVR